MKCSPTDVPAIEEIDIPAMQAKYRVERDKRIRSEGQKQYERPVDDFADEYEGDPHMPVEPREALSEDIDVAVLGAGLSGLMAGVHLRKAGVTNFRNIDHAGDFGGVWYWNRYPGIQCDNDAYCYLPMLEEMGFMPSQKFADGPEIYAYCQSIAERFELYEKALFHTLIKTLRWDASIRRWRITTDRGDDIRARFVVMANGLLNIPKLPGIPGIHEFKGKMFHTARWEYDYTGGSCENPVLDKLADKNVAIVGTGATAIQAIPHLGRHCKHLYVLQRTPSCVDIRRNPPTDPQWQASLKPGWQEERIENFHHAAMEAWLAPGEPDLICDFWTEISRNMQAELEAEGWPELSTEEFIRRREEMDYRVMERLRRRVESLVDDPATAESLKPYYRFLCKRPLSNETYLETFNLPNVTLIDVADTQGVEAMTETGFVHKGEEYDLDCMIFASGFEVTSDLERRWGFEAIEGRDGRSLYEDWAHGYKTLHGMMAHGFPNQFFVGYYQGGLNSTTTEQYGRQGHHIAWIIKHALDSELAVVEPSAEAQAAWIEHMRETAVDISAFQMECTPSYFNNEGEKDVDENGNERIRWYLGESYGPGWHAFEKLLADWREDGALEGMLTEQA
ncbi:NAD(P)/FAD-dependent oxidoreductase [Mangrovimicrobium sediminis]|uniref:NAD(P)/FAD-dependent oxidoreductase n=1 Tax=Mangrovimicrobium sediminis TaxID=2562682 RepID=A0A4Z0LVH2_9GAMM|nr:NAD(P)/FAD-dependent oxidoreductase [Haliea sp. SAOS-164]TGD71055.1 NAD(P)/FAD-dependent oxidoreductase [Haliea sp. SAOS-164]